MLLLAAPLVAFAAPPKVEETIVGTPAPRTMMYGVSRAGSHYVSQVQKGAKIAAVIDGVEGPEIDRVLTPRATSAGLSERAVLFSPDGRHHAYFGAVGGEYVFVWDGKVAHRDVLTSSNLNYQDLKFSPGSKHVYFVDLKPDAESRAAARLILDAKPGPITGHQDLLPVFSPDDSRWAYTAVKYGGARGEMISVVDGKEVPFIGFNPAFAGDNKLYAALPAKGTEPAVVTVDGRPVFKGLTFGGKIGPSPVGSRWAGQTVPTGMQEAPLLCIDGKPVAGAEYPQEVIFSPDGKRYMAICWINGRKIKAVFTDGKKGPEYQTIPADLMKFTPDSSKAIYVGISMTGRNQVVVEGQPSEEFDMLLGQTDKLVMPKVGARYAYVATSNSGVQTLVVDGKVVPTEGKSIVLDTLSFSPEGSHYAYINGKAGVVVKRGLVVDGVELPVVNVTETGAGQTRRDDWIKQWGTQSKYYVFSPDGKHVATTGQDAANRYFMFVDGKPIYASFARDMGFVSWTADSKHLAWTALEKGDKPAPFNRIIIDGAPTAVTFEYNEMPVYPGIWQMEPGGALQVILFQGEVTKRFRFSPDNETTILTALAKGLPAVAEIPPAAPAPATAPKPAPSAAPVPVAAAPKPAAASALPGPAPSAAAAAPELTWAMMASRPELRPATCTINRDFKFQGGVTVSAGTKVSVLEAKPSELVVSTTDGKINFALAPQESDALEVARANWAQLTAEQRALTYPALLRRPDLWPYRLKLAQPLELSGRQLRAGDSVLFLSWQGNQLLVRLDGTEIGFNVAPEETDLMIQARVFLAGESGAPGRLLEELNGKLISPLDGRPVKLDPAVRPKYVMLYMGASWCAPCQVFSPKLAKALQAKAPKPEDLAMIYLSGDKTPAEMKTYVTKMGVAWPTVRYTNTGQLPAFSSLFGSVIPQLVVTDRHGKVLIDSARVGHDRALAQLLQLL